MRYLTHLGFTLVGVDRDPQAIAEVSSLGEAIEADIENTPWPLGERQFGAVVVTNYLWRPLWPQILNSLATDGVLIYETFAAGNETVGKPSRPDFLLQPGELLARCAALHIVAYEDGFLYNPERFVQRIVAIQSSDMQKLGQRFDLRT
jgi:SAM-dependent methyltransferase